MALTPYGLNLSEGQKKSLAKAAINGVSVTLRLSADQLHGDDRVGLTNRQIAHLKKKAGSDLLEDSSEENA